MKNVWSFAFSFSVVLLSRVADTSGILIVTFQLYRYSCVYRLNDSPLKLGHRSINVYATKLVLVRCYILFHFRINEFKLSICHEN